MKVACLYFAVARVLMRRAPSGGALTEFPTRA